MTETAFDTIKETYDIDTLREIVEHGCESGVAHDHIYYRDTIKFFDEYEDEVVEYIADTLGGEFNEELWNNNPCNITGYKNDSAWCYVELVASLLVDQYEDITQEELSNSDEYYVADDGEVVFKCDEEYMKNEISNHGYTAKDLSNSTYEAVKELASTPWGQDHLEIVSA